MTFTHRDATTPEAAWAAWPALAALPALRLDDVAHLLVVAAHPDDETLGAGGLVATAAERGLPVDVVVATDGEGSHPDSPTTTPEALAAQRVHEVAAAVRLLAPRGELHLLHVPDAALAEHEDRLADALRSLVRPGGVVVAPWRGDAHGDHEAAGRAAAAVARDGGLRLLEYPVWAWHWSRPGDDRLPWPTAVRLPLGDGPAARKRAAMAVHHTQVGPLSALPGDEALLAPQVLAHFERADETFFETGAP